MLDVRKPGRKRCAVLHITSSKSRIVPPLRHVTSSISTCHDSSPLVSPPYRPLLSNLVNGGALKPWYGTCALDTATPGLYSPGLALFDCKACLAVVIPEPILNSLASSPDPPAVEDGEEDAPRPGVGSPKPLPALTRGEYGLLAEGENDETWSNITLSSVAFIRRIMFARRSAGIGLSAPWFLNTLHSKMTALANAVASSRSAFLSAAGSDSRTALMLSLSLLVKAFALTNASEILNFADTSSARVSIDSQMEGAISTATFIASTASLSKSVLELEEGSCA